MYKPDPRLPPDQQILPTHAKRTIQGQTDSQEEVDKSFPKDFDLLSDEELAKMGALPPPGQAQEENVTTPKPKETNTLQPPWPLAAKKSDAKSQTGSLQGASSGYKTTAANVSSTSPQPPTVQPEAPRNTRPAVQRMPEPDEKEDGKKKKKLACCVVM